MTTFFGGQGFGGQATATPSREAQALKAIDSRQKPFVNKDFVKNIQWLNQSVDTLSIYTQKLQQGVDNANQNALEQVQGIIADLIVIFAGGTPTGINLGDLQYIFQAIGALLGINPDTVFPLNLVEAVSNLFQQFIVPLPQFTDVIFDGMMAWMAELGFSDEAIQAVQEFSDAVVDLYNGWNDVTANIIPMLNNFLKMLGFGSGWLSLDFLKEFVRNLQARVNELLAGPRELLFRLLNELIITLFQALTWLVNMINPRNIMRAIGVENIGPQLAPDISDSTVVWQVGSNANTQWVYDNSVLWEGSGSFRTNGMAYGKRILTQGTEPTHPDETFALSAWLRWEDVPVGQNQWGPCIVWMAGLNEVGQANIDAPIERGTTGGWVQVGRNVVAPGDCDGFKIGFRCATSVSDGIVWGSGLSCANISTTVDLIGAVGNLIWGCILTVFENIRQIFLGGIASLAAIPEAVRQGFATVFNEFSNWMSNIGVNLPAAINQAAQAIWYFAELLYNTGTSGIQALAKLITDLWATINQIAQIFSGSFVGDALNNTVQQFLSWWNGVGAALGDLPAAVQGAVSGLQSILSGAGITVYENLTDAGQQLGAAVNAAQEAVWQIIQGAGVNINQTLTAASEMLGVAISGAQELGQGVVDALNNAAQGVSGAVGAALSTAYENFNAMINAIPIWLQGLSPGQNYSQAQQNAALEAQREANEARAAQIKAIQNEFAAIFDVNPTTYGNTRETIDFGQITAREHMSGVMLPNAVYNASCMGIRNIGGSNVATWLGGDGSDIQLFPIPTVSDYQVIDVTLAGLNDVYAILQGSYATDFVIVFRSNSSRNTYTGLRLRGNVASLICVVSGTEYTLANSAALGIAASSTFRIVAGDSTTKSLNTFQVLHNGVPCITFNSLTPLVGAGFRFIGLRMSVSVAGRQDFWGPAGPGAYSCPWEYYYNTIDYVLLGGGGGGKAMPLIGTWGEGGWNGSWAVGVLDRRSTNVYATQVHPGVSAMTGNVGGGGAGGTGGGAGGAGGASNAICANTSGVQQQFGYAAGGRGGSQSNLDTTGKQPNPYVMNYWGYNYDSGGAGSGGPAATVSLTQGVAGTGGRAWFRRYNPIDLYPPSVKSFTYQDNPPPATAYPFKEIPEPGVKGRVYLPDDTGLLLRDNGERWERFMGGPLGFFTPPPKTGWVQYSLPAGHTFDANDVDGTVLTSPATAAWQFQMRPLPAGNYVLTVYLEFDYLGQYGIPIAANIGAYGPLALWNGVSNFITFGPGCVNIAAAAPWHQGLGQYVVSHVWVGVNASSGVHLTVANYHTYFAHVSWIGEIPHWYRIVDDGYQRYFLWSKNGNDWHTYKTMLRTDQFTPTHVGLGTYGGGGDVGVRLRLRSWHGIA